MDKRFLAPALLVILTVLAFQHLAGDAPASASTVPIEKFETGFYKKVTDMTSGSDTLRSPAGVQQYYTVVIIVEKYDADGTDVLDLQKDRVVKKLEDAGARDINVAQTLSFVTASVPVDQIVGLSAHGEVRLLGDGQTPLMSHDSNPAVTINATAAALATASGIANGAGATVAVLEIGGINSPRINDKIVLRLDCSIDNGSGMPCVPHVHVSKNDHANAVAHYIGTTGHSRHNGLSPGASIIGLSAGPTVYGMINALDWAATHDVDVVTMSVGIALSCTLVPKYSLNVVADDVVLSGTMLMSAAANTGPEYESLILPCSYNMVTVGGIDDSGDSINMYNDSSRGPNLLFSEDEAQRLPVMKPEIVAPGYLVPVILPSGNVISSGTSFSTPMVAAAAAIMLGESKHVGPEGVRAALFLGANWTGPVPCTSAQFEQDDVADDCSHARQPVDDDHDSIRILNNVGFGILNVGKSLYYHLQEDGQHIIAGNLPHDGALQYRFDVTADADPVKVILTWLNNQYDLPPDPPDNFTVIDGQTYDLNLEVACPGMSPVSANSAAQNNEFAVFTPVRAGTCIVTVNTSDTVSYSESKRFALASTVPFNVRSPAPSIIVASTNTTAVVLDVDFGAAIKADTFAASDVEAPAGTVSEPATSDDQTFRFDITNFGNYDLEVSIPAGTVEYASGETNSAATIRIERGASPVVTLSTFSPDRTRTADVTFTADFSEPVSFGSGGVSGISVTGGTASGLSPAGSARTFTFAVEPSADGDVTVQVPAGAATDGTNENTASEQVTLRFDNTVPEIVSLGLSGQDPPHPSGTEFTVTFSEDVTFVKPIKVTGGEADPAWPKGTSDSFTFNVVPYAGGQIVVKIPENAVYDGVGNENAASSEKTIAFPGVFVTTWNTASANEVIALPLEVHSGGTAAIDWGDGSTETVNADDTYSHTYLNSGKHRVSITGDLSRINLDGPSVLPAKLASIDGWGDIRWSDMEGAFRGASNMVYTATDVPDLSGVTSTQSMFEGAASFNGDISAWNTSAVTDMSRMFARTASFNGDISAWNTGAVTDMSGMFEGAASFNGDISAWNTTAVTDMSHMFTLATSFNSNISAWNTTAVTDMSYMFSGAASFNGDISAWNTGAVAGMFAMFNGATSFNSDISAWNTGAVTDMSYMFDGATSFNSDISAWNTGIVTGMSHMFSGATSFNGDISAWNTGAVDDMTFMFSGAASFNSDISAWDIGAVAHMSGMFNGATDFDQNLGEWYVVLDDAVISGATETLNIRVQNSFLDGQGIVYGLGTGGDSGRFMVNAAAKTLGLNPNDVPHDGTYRAIVTSTGGFGTANHREVAVTVEGIRPAPVPPTFVSSELDIDTGVLTITFSETIDAANIVPAKMHIRESGNYTHGTTLTAGELDTDADGATVSFTLTPSHRAAVAGLAAPELTIEPGAVRDESGNLIVGTFDASTGTFVDATRIQKQETQPRDIAFSNDGTKMFIVGDISDNVNEYALSTPFDASTRTFVNATSIRDQDHQPRGMAFSNDGAKLFVIGYLRDSVNEYALSTPFNVSTLTFTDATSIQAQEDDARSVAFSNDGTKMFVMGVIGDDINEYALSTPFDASTLTFTDATPISSEEAFPTGMVFSNDGAKLFVIGWNEYVNEYALSTPFDASTLTFTDATSISSEETDSQGIAFSSDGAKMFIIGIVGDDVNEYDLSSVYPVTVTRMPPTFVASELDIDAGVLTITFSETIDAANIVPAKMHIRESGNYTHGVTLTAGELDTDADGATVSFNLTTSHRAAVAGLAAPELTIEPGAVRDESGNLIVGTFDASTRTFVDATSIRAHDPQPRDIAFSNDGTKMFVIGGIIDSVKEYALSTPFDASTLTLTGVTDISSQDSQPRGMAFSNYGTKMFVIDSGTNDVNEYALSTPFDAFTLAFIDATDISLWETDPTGIAFSNDGTKMFILGGDGEDVNEYDLSSPFDASTLSFVNATGIDGQDTSPRGIAFSNDGTKMFMLGGDGDDVNEYDLSSPF